MKAWKTTEISLIREKYPTLGLAGVAKLLPTRSIASVQSKARDLRLKTNYRYSNELLVSAMGNLIHAVETNGDIESAMSEAKSTLNKVRGKQ